MSVMCGAMCGATLRWITDANKIYSARMHWIVSPRRQNNKVQRRVKNNRLVSFTTS